MTKLYADDTKILTTVNSDLHVGEIQNDLDSAFKWTKDWLLGFNINKCVVMHYSSCNTKRPLFINGIQVSESDSERDLCVILNINLKWKDKVTTAIGKANQMPGRIKKSFAKFDCRLLRSLYVTFIRPL